jgi:hypothetical protein
VLVIKVGVGIKGIILCHVLSDDGAAVFIQEAVGLR